MQEKAANPFQFSTLSTSSRQTEFSNDCLYSVTSEIRTHLGPAKNPHFGKFQNSEIWNDLDQYKWNLKIIRISKVSGFQMGRDLKVTMLMMVLHVFHCTYMYLFVSWECGTKLYCFENIVSLPTRNIHTYLSLRGHSGTFEHSPMPIQIQILRKEQAWNLRKRRSLVDRRLYI